MKTKALCYTVAMLLLPAIAAAGPSEFFCMATDAWSCVNPRSVEVLEQMARRPGGSSSAEFREIEREAKCISYPHLEGRDLVSNKITVMYVDKNDAYFCQKLSAANAGNGVTWDIFSCRYALITDIRDPAGNLVSRERLARSSARTTMWDVTESANCAGY